MDTVTRAPDAPSASIVEVRMEPSARAPYVARQVVGALVRHGPRLRALDAALLASEAASLHLDSAQPIVLQVTDGGRFVSVEVQSGLQRPVGDIARALFNRLASTWDSSASGVRFEIELIRRQRLEVLTDEELFALLPDDRDARVEIYERYESFAISLSWRFAKKRGHQEDVIQVALSALVDAIDRFDPDYGVRFTTYAGKTITGTLKRYLRDFTWSVRVPRSVSDAAVDLIKVRSDLAQRLGRFPTNEELAEETDSTVQDIQRILEAGRVAYRADSLDAPISLEGDDGGLLSKLGEDDPSLDLAGVWESVLPSIEELPSTERQVLQMRFFEDMTQNEIAEVIGVSQMQVSRLISKAIDRLRGRVGAVED